MSEGRNFNFQQKNEYSVLLRMHGCLSTPTKSNNVFLVCLAQSQGLKSHSWFSDQSIRSGCVPLFLHM